MNKMEIQQLDLYYGSFQALKKIDLNICEKEITAFIGPSGCGKSTLLKSLNHMNDLVEGCRIEGKVLLDGADVYRDMESSLLHKCVGMVFQKPNPFPMSIYDKLRSARAPMAFIQKQGWMISLSAACAAPRFGMN